MSAQRDLLRFITCGSVDDGKSTLIGRLLHECGLIFDDTLAALSRAGGQSSRSFRLGERLGSLAKKPNTKIQIKKNTTE